MANGGREGSPKMTNEKLSSQPKQTRTLGQAETHHCLEAHAATLQAFQAPSPEEKKKILRARAMELAREGEQEKTAEETVEIVEFLLAHEKYGIQSSYIREICPLKELTPVPCTPSFVLGIINLRGQILSIIDIKKFFDLPERNLTNLNKVIVLGNDKMDLGILADLIVGVQSIPVSQIQPSLPTLTGIREQYLKGVTMDHVVILDVEQLLSSETITVHEEVGT
jgi:purine-binding chemotaxis protein CheW